jgi:1-acyl-sn-glycerol-3-phosphate acyltransferase
MKRLADCLRFLFFLIVVRPVMLIFLGFHVRGYDRLPKKGPLIVVANHNSHLDALALVTLFGMKRLKDVHPVAAADYFLKNRFMAWFSLNIIGIIPFERRVKNMRKGEHENPLEPISKALKNEQIVILFPEGSRGEPEKLEEFKTGIAHIAARHPQVPVTPIFLHGLGKSLPRGEALLVPFICDLLIGEPMTWTGERKSFMDELNHRMKTLASELNLPPWA